MRTNHQQLREATNALHEGLHVHPVLKPLVSTDITKSQLVTALAAFASAYERTERSASDEARASLPVVTWLQEDLAFHEAAWPAPIESHGFILDWQNPAQMVGYTYVKQGSAMGGQVISRALQKNLGLKPGVDNRFFYGYGSARNADWKQLVYTIEQLDAVQLNDAIGAAVETFRWITYCCDHYHSR